MLLVADNARTGVGPDAVSMGQLPNASPMSPPADKSEGTNHETSDFMSRIQQVLDDLRHNDGSEPTAHGASPGCGEIDRIEAQEQRPLEGWGNIEQGRGEEPIDGLRRQVDELHQRLAESERHRSMLQQQLSDAGGSRLQDSERGETQEELRRQRLEIERERAELDRQRTELEYERRGIERSGDRDEINERVQVLRQHLQEIHAKEQTQRQGGGLPAWIARLREQLGYAVQRWMRPRPQRANHANK